MTVDAGGGTEAYPSPRLEPWAGFALAAEAAVTHLNARFGLDLWLVTHVLDGRQSVVASAGHWAALASPGTEFSWRDSLCIAMVERRAPTVALDVSTIPAYAQAATGVLSRVRAYVGVPLEGDGGEFFGTLCALAGTVQPAPPADLLNTVELVGQMLSTIVAHEQVAVARSREAAAAYALAERDEWTGLLNRRGWGRALLRESQRVDRYGSNTGIVTITIDEVQRSPDGAPAEVDPSLLARCAEELVAACRPGDVQARLGGAELVALAVECDARALQALLIRLRVGLRTTAVPASIGGATRRVGEDLDDCTARASAAREIDRQRHRRRARPYQPDQ